MHKDTPQGQGPLPKPISVAEVAATIQASCGNHFCDSANKGDDTHSQMTLFARIRFLNQNAAGLSHVMKYRGEDIGNPNIAALCKTCQEPIPNNRIEALDYAVEDCIKCRETKDRTQPTRQRR